MKLFNCKSGLSKSKLLATLFVSTSCLLSPTVTHSDDLEIYSSITSNNGTDTANHNILFVMDTSGSMANPAAGISSNTSDGYAPDTDYGNSPEGIYVYDIDNDNRLAYSNAFIPFEQNACQALESGLDSATTYPVYSDLAIQWVPTSQTETGTCPPAPEAVRTVLREGDFDFTPNPNNNAGNRTVFTINSGIPAGTNYEVEITTSQAIAVRVFNDINTNGSTNTYGSTNTDSCNNLNVAANETVTCSGTIVAGNNRLRLRAGGNDDATITYSAVKVTAAPPADPCTPSDPITTVSGEWERTIATNTDSGSRLECFRDEGTHGLTEESVEIYASLCGANDCASPSYSSDITDKLTQTGSSKLYFVSANYHDFLQPPNDNRTTIATGIFSTEQDAKNYCTAPSRIGDIFTDSNTGLIYQCFTRVAIMQAAVSNLVSSLSASPINIGLMRFNDNNLQFSEGGTVIDAVQSVANNSDFITKLNNLVIGGGTPLSESIYESYLYYAGASRDNGRRNIYGIGVAAGNRSGFGDQDTCVASACTDSTALTGNTYVSPITAACQSNNIILLTDGEPSVDTQRDSEIIALINNQIVSPPPPEAALPAFTSCGNDGFGDDEDGACLNDLAGGLAKLDFSVPIDGVNNVRTHTIGLSVDFPLLANTASQGKGEFAATSDLGSLQAAFQSIIIEILSESSSFIAPAVSVNAFNQLQNRSEVYFTVFEPAGTPRWPGNVKRYNISSSGLLNGTLVDSLNRPAVDPNTGFFSETARSFWSDSDDGSDVRLGGFTEQLDTARNIYTEDGSNAFIKLATSNFTSIPTTALGGGNIADRTLILSWLLGIDVYDDDGDGSFVDTTNFSGDSIHSRPFVVTYSGTADAPNDVLFTSTNLGTLHAINPATTGPTAGTELWAYLPKEHQDNLRDYARPNNTTQHTYGLDGNMTVITTEKATSNLDNFALDSVKLYLGERRGGSRYYAIDASNARMGIDPIGGQLDSTSPKPLQPLWKITGALSGANAATQTPDDSSVSGGFQDLAQTWSSMVPSTLKYIEGGISVEKSVFIFSGGYDPRHDVADYNSTATTSDYGNAIYIVNADTGALIYSIGNNSDTNEPDRTLYQHDLDLAMRDSIPSTPSVIDINGDGVVDIIFAIDITGHVWRIDLDKSKTLNNSTLPYATGGMTYDLSASATVTTNGNTTTEPQRFYHNINVVRSDPTTGSDHLNLVVGSGYQASPSSTESLNNRFYILFDKFINKREFGNPTDALNRYKYAANSSGGFRTAVRSDVQQSTNGAPKTISDSPQGIFTVFSGPGEKLLQPTSTFNGRVIFSSYVTNGGASAGTCGGDLGSSRLYIRNINNGLSILLDDQENIVEFSELQRPGISATTSIIFGAGGLTACTGTECNKGLIGVLTETNSHANSEGLKDFKESSAVRTFWRED